VTPRMVSGWNSNGVVINATGRIAAARFSIAKGIKA